MAFTFSVLVVLYTPTRPNSTSCGTAQPQHTSGGGRRQAGRGAASVGTRLRPAVTTAVWHSSALSCKAQAPSYTSEVSAHEVWR